MKKSSQVFPQPGKETKITELVKETSTILFSAKTVFPFSLFPDRIIIHPLKIDIVVGEFFLSKYTKSMLLKDIGGSDIVTTPFLSTITILSNKPTIQSITINNLWRKDAIKIKEIIDGLVASLSQDIDTKNIKKRILPKIEKLGEMPEKT